MTIPNLEDWIRLHGTFDADPNKKVDKVEFQIEVKDAVSSTSGVNRVPIYFTDIQFQAGSQLTGWIPNTKEMLERLSWTHDENTYVASPNRFNGEPPRIYEDVEKRWFNIVGRGHNTFVVPNYLPEDWDVPLVPTGIDLTIYPKDDFDLLRISTNAGAVLPEDRQWYKNDDGIYQEMKRKYEQVTSENYNGSDDRKEREISNWENIIVPLLDKHPLHTRYTREFWVEGLKAGSEIKVHATPRIATVDGEDVRIVGENEIDVNGTKFPIDRKKFMLAPKGTSPIRIEFYKQVEREIVTYEQDSNHKWNKTKKKFKYLEDVGIGYHGTASFYQWTYGHSRI